MEAASSLPEIKEEQKVPIFVDLDGTLLKTDTIFELLILLIRNHFLHCFKIPWWLLRGRAHCKSQISRFVALDPPSLPYNTRFLNYLKKKRRQGHELYLATGSYQSEAQAIADYLGIFSGVLATDGTQNLVGEKKLAAIQAQMGSEPFAYAGNSLPDLAIWRHSEQAILVSPMPGLRKSAAQLTNIEAYFARPRSAANALWRGLRIYQWIKNLLIFVPVIAAHEFTDIRKLGLSALGFVAFSLIASTVYLINDLLDLQNDRHHVIKRKRPFANGDLPLWSAFLLAPILLVTGFSIATLLNPTFTICLAAYLMATTLYSAKLKSLPVVDVISLALLYTIRVIAGGLVTDLNVSLWLLGFCCFFFFSLALAKRSTELAMTIRKGTALKTGRDYHPQDLPLINALGVSTSCMAVLILAIYVASPAVSARYNSPHILWLLCVTVLYWVARIWIVTNRGKMHHDPIVFAVRDRASHACLAICVVIFVIATYF